ncbi:hypothetical protein BMF94_5286 [Rhodotorula taiwanensis]|uniref:Uncharacterized protein n=1 Tax=Rhodotorula taiwanensis TaxID=741276 RepID=A0A2S5B4J5_9BASI|nr:hypothetical protein BMF94_5286 [Rhodotorula taiwanensis]
MPPKSRSSSSKAATQKAALGFSATKKGVPPSSKQQGAAAKATKVSAQTNGKATTKKSDLAGLYPRLYKEALRKMGPPIHRDEMDDIEIILRVFDADEEYGPCSRVWSAGSAPRSSAFNRIPRQIGEILRSEEGKSTKAYSDSIFQI